MRTSLRSSLLVILWLLAFGAVVSIGQDAYFPKGALSEDSWSDQFKANWYSHELKDLKEPSLTASNSPSAESYRFLWLRTFNNPVAIRLDLQPDGTGVLTTKVANGESGFFQVKKHLIQDVSRPLTREQVQEFLAQVKRANFWSLPSNVNDQEGTDGSQWIIEGAKKGKYHVVDRWSPTEGAIRKLGLSLTLGMAQMNVPKDQLY
jgi:hypothetical protein